MKVLYASKENILEKVADILRADPAEIDPEKDLYSDLGVNSLDAVEILMAIEYEFGISISDEEAEQFRTLGDVFSYLEKK